MRPLLGTFVEIGVLSNQNEAGNVITEAFSLIEKLHNLLSFQDPDSQLSTLNKSGTEGIELHPLSASVLKLSINMTTLSGGAFNCTLGGVLVNKGILPNHFNSPFLDYGTANDITLHNCHAKLQRPVLITLDGIAKGFAIDQAIIILKKRGINSGWVNAGGDMRIFGDIEKPVYRRELNGTTTFLGDFSNIAIATSTTQSQYDERFPGHIINAETQKAVSGIWTVTASSSWLADSLTKVAAVTPEKEVCGVISSLGGTLVKSIP